MPWLKDKMTTPANTSLKAKMLYDMFVSLSNLKDHVDEDYSDIADIQINEIATLTTLLKLEEVTKNKKLLDGVLPKNILYSKIRQDNDTIYFTINLRKEMFSVYIKGTEFLIGNLEKIMPKLNADLKKIVIDYIDLYTIDYYYIGV